MTPDAGTDETAEVVIVGGGVMGTSVAAHLARAGTTDVLLLEAHDLAGGSSGKPLGGVRAQFSDRLNVELGARSLEAFGRFEAEWGADIGLRRVGYLFLFRDAGDTERYEAAVALQNGLGVPSRMLTPGEAAALSPYVDPGSLVAAAFSPDDGYARPAAVVRGYAGAATARGARVRTGTPVEGVDETADGRWRVRTPSGTVTAPTIVVTAGAWSGRVGAMVGVDLPITPVRRQIAFTPPLDPPSGATPFTIDYATTAYVHPDGDGGLVVGMSDPAQAPGFDTTADDSWHPLVRTALAACAPALADLPLQRGWAGLYEVTPDCNAVVGEAPPSAGGARVLYAAGFSGHGFLQGPAVGEAVADLVLGRTPAVDVSAFDAARFAPAARGSAVRTELGII